MFQSITGRMINKFKLNQPLLCNEVDPLNQEVAVSFNLIIHIQHILLLDHMLNLSKTTPVMN